MALNVKQEAFCLHYAKTGNATESYKKAGYEAKSPTAIYSTANKLLKNAKVQERLRELADELKSDKIATVKEMQEILTSIIRQEMTEEQIVVEGCGDGISEAVIKTKKASFKDVVSAIDKLARMQGAYENKTTLNVCIPVFGGEEDLEE